MLIVDFSKPILPFIPNDEIWKKELNLFLHEWYSDNEFILNSTSGSTGVPKKIKLPKEAMRMSAKMTAQFFGLQKGNSALLCLPVHYIAGKMMVVRAIEIGLKLICIEPKSVIKFDGIVDFAPLTPMQVENSLPVLAQIKKLLIGGAPVSESLRDNLKNIPTQCYESYGMTETITHIALKKIKDEYFHTLEGVHLKLDQRACLVIKTPYFKDEIITNDLVNLKNEHEFKWLGRIDNVINSGGVKLFPEEIEKKLRAYIYSEFIIGSIPDKLLGEKVILVVESEKILEIKIPAELLSKFEDPKEIYFMKKFPRTESGKMLRKKILELVQNK